MHVFSNLSSNQRRNTLLAVALIIIGAALFWLTDSRGMAGDADIPIQDEKKSIMKDTFYPRAKEIVAPGGYVNTDGKPVTIGEYVGKKVVLVDILTYSCINCVRVQPYLNAWHDKYKDAGLQIIGIHTPEFEFEKNIDNVTKAMRDMGVQYPVVLDNDYGTWRAYQNSYWPRKYLIDIDGYIVYDHIGEGGYEETERKIQELLAERAERLGEKKMEISGTVTPAGVEERNKKPNTPEIYFGADRNRRYLANGNGGVEGSQVFTLPADVERDALYLNGTWDITSEFARAKEGGSIKIRYRGKDIYMVASSPDTARMEVLVDGKRIKKGDAMAGADVGADGSVTIHDERIYKIIEGEYGEHTLELQILNGPLDAFTFTFG